MTNPAPYDRALSAAERVERLSRSLGAQRALREACRTEAGAEFARAWRERTEAELDAARAGMLEAVAILDALGEGLAEFGRGEATS